MYNSLYRFFVEHKFYTLAKEMEDDGAIYIHRTKLKSILKYTIKGAVAVMRDISRGAKHGR